MDDCAAVVPESECDIFHPVDTPRIPTSHLHDYDQVRSEIITRHRLALLLHAAWLCPVLSPFIKVLYFSTYSDLTSHPASTPPPKSLLLYCTIILDIKCAQSVISHSLAAVWLTLITTGTRPYRSVLETSCSPNVSWILVAHLEPHIISPSPD